MCVCVCSHVPTDPIYIYIYIYTYIINNSQNHDVIRQSRDSNGVTVLDDVGIHVYYRQPAVGGYARINVVCTLRMCYNNNTVTSITQAP